MEFPTNITVNNMQHSIASNLQKTDRKVKKYISSAHSEEAKAERINALATKLDRQFANSTDKKDLVAFDMLAFILENGAVGADVGKFDEVFINNYIKKDCPELFEKGKVKDQAALNNLMKSVNTSIEIYNKIRP